MLSIIYYVSYLISYISYLYLIYHIISYISYVYLYIICISYISYMLSIICYISYLVSYMSYLISYISYVYLKATSMIRSTSYVVSVRQELHRLVPFTSFIYTMMTTRLHNSHSSSLPIFMKLISSLTPMAPHVSDYSSTCSTPYPRGLFALDIYRHGQIFLQPLVYIFLQTFV